MSKQIIPNGSKVNTEYGVFEVINCNTVKDKYFCYKNNFEGHSGESYFDDKYINTKYDGQCWWFSEDQISLIEESKVSNTKQPKDYRRMKPTDLIDIVLDGNEFKVPLGDLVHTKALMGITNGLYGFDLWKAFDQLFKREGFIEDNDTVFEFVEKQKQTIEHFFKPHYDEQQKKDLEAQIAAKSNELLELQSKLKELQN